MGHRQLSGHASRLSADLLNIPMQRNGCTLHLVLHITAQQNSSTVAWPRKYVHGQGKLDDKAVLIK